VRGARGDRSHKDYQSMEHIVPAQNGTGFATAMSTSSPDDVSSTTPNDVERDPLGSFSSQLETVWTVLELLFDDPKEFVEDLYRDILELPPEDRFKRGIEPVRERIQQEFGSVKHIRQHAPQADPERLFGVLRQILETARDEAARGVFYHRDPEAHVVLLAAYQRMIITVNQFESTDDSDERDRLLSALLALFARIYDVASDGSEDESKNEEKEVLRQIAADIQWVEFVARDGDAPREMGETEIRDRARLFGAVVAYATLNISLSRGAELGRVSTDEFRAALDLHGVTPRHGPDSIDGVRPDVDD